MHIQGISFQILYLGNGNFASIFKFLLPSMQLQRLTLMLKSVAERLDVEGPDKGINDEQKEPQIGAVKGSPSNSGQ